MSISVKNGKITLTEGKIETEIDIEYVKKDIKSAIKSTGRESLYVAQARTVVKKLDSGLLEAKNELARLLGIEVKEGFTMGGKAPTPSQSTPLTKCNNETAKQVFGIRVGKGSKKKTTRGLGTPVDAKINFKQWYDWVGMIKQFAKGVGDHGNNVQIST